MVDIKSLEVDNNAKSLARSVLSKILNGSAINFYDVDLDSISLHGNILQYDGIGETIDSSIYKLNVPIYVYRTNENEVPFVYIPHSCIDEAEHVVTDPDDFAAYCAYQFLADSASADMNS